MQPCQLPPIWVINLKRSVERRAYITRHLDNLGLPYELIEAVDGRALSPQELAVSSGSREARRLIKRELTPGDVGCSLSHLALYRKQLDEGLNEVVILEDDAVVDPALPEILNVREFLPPDWELVSFIRLDSRVSFWGSRPLGKRRCVKFASIAYGTQGYLLRRSGAEKLLAHGYPVRAPADWLTGGGIRTGLRLYGIDPPCVRALPREQAPTTNPEAAGQGPRWPARRECSRFFWFLHRCKWGLIHFYQRANPFCIV
jgi:glycosyl transferase, family 25